MKKKKDNLLKGLVGHLSGDIKGFRGEIAGDKDLIKKAKKKKAAPKKIKEHLKEDMQYYKKETAQDKKIIKKMKKKKDPKKPCNKIHKVMEEFSEGSLHSGSKKGPKVKNKAQAVAIAFSEQRRASRKRKK